MPQTFSKHFGRFSRHQTFPKASRQPKQSQTFSCASLNVFSTKHLNSQGVSRILTRRQIQRHPTMNNDDESQFARSSPAMRTIFSKENGGSAVSDTNLTQNNLENGDADMAKWPKRVKHRNKVLAEIHRPCQGRVSYRVTWYAAGRRQMKSFPTYAGQGGAKHFAETLVKELVTNSQVAMLTPPQATDALAAIERLDIFDQTTGRKISLLAAVSEYCEAAAKSPGRSLPETIEGYNHPGCQRAAIEVLAGALESAVGIHRKRHFSIRKYGEAKAKALSMLAGRLDVRNMK